MVNLVLQQKNSRCAVLKVDLEMNAGLLLFQAFCFVVCSSWRRTSDEAWCSLSMLFEHLRVTTPQCPTLVQENVSMWGFQKTKELRASSWVRREQTGDRTGQEPPYVQDGLSIHVTEATAEARSYTVVRENGGGGGGTGWRSSQTCIYWSTIY